MLELNDGTGVVPAVVTSDDEAVLRWAERTFERYKHEAEPIDIDALEAAQ
jgi:predicted transcriptional regulator